MKSAVSVNKTRTLMAGKIAGLSLLATFAIIFVTPLISLASPSMCGLPNVNATFQKVITGFTFNSSSRTYTFTDAPQGTPIMVGTWLAVQGTDGMDVPIALEQPFTLSANGKYKSNAPAVPSAFITQNAMLITGIPIVPQSCQDEKMCHAFDSKKTAEFEEVISGFKYDQGNDTYTFTEDPSLPLGLGSFIKVNYNNKDVPASIASTIIPVDKNDLSKGYIVQKGYLYPRPGDLSSQVLEISISQTAKDNAGKGGTW